MTAAGTARGCPSWTPVRGWQDLGGCWTPPAPPSWWTPQHISGVVMITAAAGVIFLLWAMTGCRPSCQCSGWPHAPWCPRSRRPRKAARVPSPTNEYVRKL